METSNTVAALAAVAADFLNVGTLHTTPGFDGSQSPTVAPKIHWLTGTNSALFAGIVKERVTESPSVPPRNQTGPLCPAPAYAPVESLAQGLVLKGRLMAHCQ